MRWKNVLLCLIGASFLFSLFADEVVYAPAPKKEVQVQPQLAGTFGEKVLESLNTTGLVKLNRTTVSETLTVNGSLIAQGATIGSIDVVGEANLTDTLIEKGGIVLGYIQATHTRISEPLVLDGKKGTFTASHLKGITIRPMSAYKGKQIIELRQKTIVDGPISFQSGKGEVHLYSGSQVTGPVTGGKVIKKS